MMKTVRSLCMAVVGTALLAATASPGQGQEGMELGFRGGYSAAGASVDVDQTFTKTNRNGFTAGVFLSHHAGLLGLEVGAQYTKKGVDLEVDNVLHQFDLTYAEFPAVVKLGVPVGVLKPSVFGGGGLGFNLGCDAGGGVDCGDDIGNFEWSGIVGADLALYLGTISLWADGRYHIGLNDVIDASDVVTGLKNRNWTFQVGIAVLIEYFSGI